MRPNSHSGKIIRVAPEFAEMLRKRHEAFNVHFVEKTKRRMDFTDYTGLLAINAGLEGSLRLSPVEKKRGRVRFVGDLFPL